MQVNETTAPPSDRVALGRHAERGAYDFRTIAGILDSGIIAHIGLVVDGRPVVLPTVYGRIDHDLYVHGSVLARWMNAVTQTSVCVTVSLIDELVLARSAYRHSMNYRSVVALCDVDVVEERDAKVAALRAVVEHVCPGRWEDVRPPSDGELKTTLVLRLHITEASAKTRTGPPRDFDHDLDHGIWAGQIPLLTVRGEPLPDPKLEPGVPVPAYAR